MFENLLIKRSDMVDRFSCFSVLLDRSQIYDTILNIYVNNIVEISRGESTVSPFHKTFLPPCYTNENRSTINPAYSLCETPGRWYYFLHGPALPARSWLAEGSQ